MAGIGRASHLYLRFSAEDFLEEATSAPAPERSIGVRGKVCTCVYLCMCEHMCVFMYICVHVCFVCICTCTCMYHLCVGICTHMHVCMYVHTHVLCTCVYAHMCGHAHTCLHYCVLVCVCVCLCVWQSGDRIRRVARSESRKRVGTRH